MKRGQASSTARLIAAATLALAADTRRGEAGVPLLPPETESLCAQLLSTTLADRWLAWSATNPLTRSLWRAVERATLPGIAHHYAHRKRWIEQQVRRAVAEGATRVVVLGAGLDTLALRLAREHAGVSLCELDHPDTHAAKCRALGQGGAGPNLCFVPCDLAAQHLPPALVERAESTVVVAEGLLMYLAPERVNELLQALAEAPAPQLRLVFSFMSCWPDGSQGFRPRSAWIERWLAWRREPFLWALEPSQVQDWLAQRGYKLQTQATTAQFTPGWQPGALEGENLVVCQRA